MWNARFVVFALVASLMLIGCNHGRNDHADHDDAVEQTITMEQVPANVRAAFEKDFAGVQVKSIEKEVYKDGTVHYGFEFIGKDGKRREVEYSADGEQLPEH